MQFIESLLSQGVWPVVMFFGMVGAVTFLALLRADRGDIPKIFASFAESFGLRHIEAEDGDPPIDQCARGDDSAEEVQ